MAITIISGNLNTYGDAGRFESDPSTWGFGPMPFSTIGRANVAYEDSHSLIATQSDFPSTDPDDYAAGNTRVATARFSAVAGKKYVVSCYVKGNPVGPLGFIVAVADGFFLPDVPVYSNTTTWSKVEVKFTSTHTYSSAFIDLWVSAADYPTFLYVDKFEIFEYEDVIIECTLAIDITTSIITNESTPGAHDGIIEIHTTGGIGSLQYSKDNGSTWQLSNQFTGLTPGIYPCKVREVDSLSCVASQSFAVNSSSYSFSFTAIPTGETILGAHDGTISITVTGTVLPFTFSKDGGATYQGSNIFNALAPGTYTIVVKDATAIVRAMNVTVAPGLGLFDKIFFSKNQITYGQNASLGWQSEINYRLYDDVRVEDVYGSGIFTSKVKVHLRPDSSGSVIFQVREAFRKLKAIPPTLNANSIVRLTDRIKYFKHYVGEVTGTDVTPIYLMESPLQLVMLGGLDKYNFASFNMFVDYVPVKKNFLTWAPIKKEVDRLQEDYLNFWIYNTTIQTIKLNIKAYYDDSSNTTSEITTKTGVIYGELYQIPAGPINSGVSSIDPTKTIVKYELWLTDQDDTIISEVRTYLVSVISKPNTRFFMFLNSLGSYEVLSFYGIADRSVNFDRKVVTSFLPIGYKAIDGEKHQNFVQFNRQGDYSSGFFKGSYAKQWRDYMVDFLSSTDIYEVVNGLRKPVVIVAETLPDVDRDYNYYVRFSIQSGYIDQSYTPEILP